jgi:phospholipase/lecithinase/hemolysin
MQALYSVGLRKFLLDGVGPLGCLPSLRASGLGPQGQCVDQVNQMVGFFNQGLRSLVDKLNADHPDAMFIYGNTYDAVYNMINNPHKYGINITETQTYISSYAHGYIRNAYIWKRKTSELNMTAFMDVFFSFFFCLWMFFSFFLQGSG